MEEGGRRPVRERVLGIALVVGSLASGVNAVLAVCRALLAALHGG